MEAEGAHTGAGVEALAAARGLALEPTAEVRELTPALITGGRAARSGRWSPASSPRGSTGALFEHRVRRPARRGAPRRSSSPRSLRPLAYAPATGLPRPGLVRRSATRRSCRPSAGPRPSSRAPPSTAATALLALAGQDPGWMRELFSPRLIAWLARRGARRACPSSSTRATWPSSVPGPLDRPRGGPAACAPRPPSWRARAARGGRPRRSTTRTCSTSRPSWRRSSAALGTR